MCKGRRASLWELIIFGTGESSFLKAVCLVRKAHLAGEKEHSITVSIPDSRLKKAKHRLRHVTKKSFKVVRAIKIMSMGKVEGNEII